MIQCKSVKLFSGELEERVSKRGDESLLVKSLPSAQHPNREDWLKMNERKDEFDKGMVGE